jgi:PIN domain nuclease of toxin-antitoxin system
VRLILDTHTLLWSADDPSKLGASAVIALNDPANDLVISAATIWEMSIKVGQGKLSLSMPFRTWMERAITVLDLDILPITIGYADRQASLPPHHKDPFDRLIIAQSLESSIPVVSVDAAFDSYGVTRIW